jgi:hypothetical protein
LTESLDKEIKTNVKETKELVSNLSSSITSELNENEIRDNAEEFNEQHNEEKSSTQSDNNLKESSTKSVLHEKEVKILHYAIKTALKNNIMITTVFFC